MQLRTGEIRMSTINVERQPEAEDLARRKRITEAVLEGWDQLTWNELLADDIVLSLRLGRLVISRISELRGCGGVFQVIGQGQAKRLLKRVYSDLRNELSIKTEVIIGYHGILIGKLTVRKVGQDVEVFPVVIYMALNSERKIKSMTVSIVDLQPLPEAIRNAPGQ
jgi:hypothetical protein